MGGGVGALRLEEAAPPRGAPTRSPNSTAWEGAPASISQRTGLQFLVEQMFSEIQQILIIKWISSLI